MSFGYEIEKGNVVVIWADEKGTPGNVVMETWPDGTKWKDKAEAEAWAKAFIAAAEDASAPRPGTSPEQKLIPVAELELSSEEHEELVKLQAEAIAAEAAALAAREAEAQAAKDAEIDNFIAADNNIVDAEIVEDAAIEAPKKAKK